MDDLISRAAAIKEIEPIRYSGDFISALIHLPAVDATPVVHARWKNNGNETVSCSRCATWFQKEREPYLRYCGWCGAKMDKED